MSVRRERRLLPVEDPWVTAVQVEVHRPARPRGPALLLTHGAGKDLDAPWLVAIADAVAGLGHLVVRVNQPWKQAGRAAPPAEHLAVPGYVTVAAAVRTAFGPRRPWVVGGHSNGARIATHALADPGDGSASVRAVGAVLVSYPLHRPGHPEAPRVDHWPAVRVPTLFLQGTADVFGGADALRSYVGMLGGPATVHAVVGADHGFAVPRTRSVDGRRHEPAEVGSTLGAVIAAWLAER